jgi:alkylhydroperoxidase/carboxymuconolactone decarboxylase family protein YurZ
MAEHPLDALRKIDPVIMDHLKATDDLVMAEGALPRRIKLLMAMAFDAAHGAEQGVRTLAAAALKEGATMGQVAEAVRVAYHLNGIGTLYTASRGLKDL